MSDNNNGTEMIWRVHLPKGIQIQKIFKVYLCLKFDRYLQP